MARVDACIGPERSCGPASMKDVLGPDEIKPRGVLALDMDGTLLRSDGTVSRRNQMAVAKCLDAGVAVVLATGRPFIATRHYFSYWPGRPLWVIAGNGAVIRHSCSATPFEERLLPLQMAQELARWAAGERLCLEVYVDDHLYVSQVREETLFFARMHDVPYTRVDNLATALPKEPTHMVIIDKPESIARLWPQVRRLWSGKLEITAASVNSIVFCAPGVTKGTALQSLVGRLGLGPERVAAIGNEHNDLSMITWAGFGGAVGNAPAAIREAASVVVSDNDADGVAEFIDLWMKRAHSL